VQGKLGIQEAGEEDGAQERDADAESGSGLRHDQPSAQRQKQDQGDQGSGTRQGVE
jgi:hypothetical protein